MYEVTIPLRPVPGNELGAPEEYFRIIRDEYAARYLDRLNIASTPANKADFMRYRMMEDCDMVGVWPDLRTSALADAIKIVPPLRQRIGDLADIDESDRSKWRQWYGHADPILVRPPDLGVSVGTMKLDLDDDDRNAGGTETGPAANFLDAAKAKAELAAELERVRVAGLAGTDVGKRVGAVNSRLDAERKERMKQELLSLKGKFIVPFACERPAKEGDMSGPSRRSELVVWSMQGPLTIAAPQEMLEEVLQPIRITLEDVKKNTSKWVDEQIPLDFLTSRKDEGLFDQVRATMKDPNVAKLTGLLAHLLHWVALMPLNSEGPHISESALQSLFVGIQELWSQFEKLYRDSKSGVSFVMPCLMLTIKRGMERCFEISYPTLMSNEMLQQQVLDSINTLLMRFFDPDCTYARFGKLDGEGKAIAITKRLDAIMASQGSTHTKRLHGRMFRATPLVKAVLGLMGTDGNSGTVVEPKTRVMMLQSEIGGCVPAGGMADPPQDRDRQRALLKAAMNRLKSEGSPRQPQSARRVQLPSGKAPQTPWSARGLGVASAMAAYRGPSASPAMGASMPAWTGAGSPSNVPSSPNPSASPKEHIEQGLPPVSLRVGDLVTVTKEGRMQGKLAVICDTRTHGNLRASSSGSKIEAVGLSVRMEEDDPKGRIKVYLASELEPVRKAPDPVARPLQFPRLSKVGKNSKHVSLT